MNHSKSTYGTRGGARKGAGRKPGAATKRTREIADKAAATGMTPLEVMLDTMTELVERAHEVKRQGAAATDDVLRLMIGAANVAKDAAPYMHPRLTSVELKEQAPYEHLTDEQLEAQISVLSTELGYTRRIVA
jgi:hypothetical protein